jgi:hypothetical protein
MTRKTLKYTLGNDCGRDSGKAFLITEMPARRVEHWAMRVFFELAKSGIDVPNDVKSAGAAGVAKFTAGAFTAFQKLDSEAAINLLDELLECVEIYTDPKNPAMKIPLLQEGIEPDIEEVMTFFKLYAKVFELHTGFSLADKLSEIGKTVSKSA